MERPLSSCEILVSEMNVATVVVLNRHGSRSALSKADVSDALASVCTQHPSLRRSLYYPEGSTQASFRDSTDTLNVESHICVDTLDTSDDLCPLPTSGVWLDRLNAELHHSFDYKTGLPPWRAVFLIGENVLVSMFIFNHSIGDGYSGLVAQRDMLTFLNDKEAIAKRTPAPCGPELRQALGTSRTKRFVSALYERLAGFDWLRGLVEPRWLYLPHLMPGTTVKTHVLQNSAQFTLLRRGTPQAFYKLKAACKLNGCTIGGFVAAALMFIGVALEPSCRGNASNRVPIGLSYDINWRDRLFDETFGDAVGFLVSFDFIETTVNRSSSKFWSLAKLATDQMRSKLNGGGTGSSGTTAEIM
jgi:hypothetical protein